MNIIRNITSLSHLLALPYINKDSICIDGTVGQGNDILFLCQNCHFVYGFDIQKQAIDNTKNLLISNKCINYKLFQQSHEYIKEVVKTNIDFAIFNLGYLPNGDKNITTQANSSLEAIKQCLDILNVDGAVMVILYYGHQQGKIEKQVIREFSDALDEKKYHVGLFELINQTNTPPEILLISKKK